VKWASCTSAFAAREVKIRQARHETGLSRRLITNKYKFWQLDIVRHAELLKLSKRVITGLKFLANVLERCMEVVLVVIAGGAVYAQTISVWQ
jgi:hypothetical protein